MIVDIDIPFRSIVRMVLKLALAVIPVYVVAVVVILTVLRFAMSLGLR